MMKLMLSVKKPPFDDHAIFDALALQFPVCMASDEFHFFPQARADDFDWSDWDDFSPTALTGVIGRLKQWEQRLHDDSPQPLPFEEKIDANMLGRVLRTLHEQLELVRPQETQPTFYLTIMGIGLAEASEAGPKALNDRLKSLPAFLDQTIRHLIDIPRLFRDLGMEMLAGQRKWLASLHLAEERATPIFEALQRLDQHLEAVKTREAFLPPIDLYERIAADHMGCQLKPDDIARELQAEVEETRSLLVQSADALSPGKPWQTVLEELSRPTVSAGGLQDLYRQAIEDLSDHLLRHGMIAGELVQSCPVGVQPIPDYMRPVRGNAAYSMPPGNPPTGGTFFIERIGQAEPPPADYRLLAAHETFPGHHLLDTCRWRHERPLRRHIEFPIFYEGWASFAEELMFDTGFFSETADRLLMAKRRFWRAMRGQVDFDIHMRRRTVDQAAGFLVSEGMPPHRAAAMVRRYCLKPGYQLAYTIGRRHFRKLYDTLYPKEKKPVAFARRVLATGEIGFSHLKQVFESGG